MKVLLLGAVGALLIGCSAAPDLGIRDASDPRQESARVAYRPVLDGYQTRRPVEPQGWSQLNRRVAPGGGDQ